MPVENPQQSSHTSARSTRQGIRASAGSGKTFALTGSYLGAFLSGAEPASMLATTFTRKAAGEILGRVTISAGVSVFQSGDDAPALIDRADACLYAAKRHGRNRVICEADPEFTPNVRIQVA